MAINKVILVGNVGKDPEVRYLDNNVTVARFPLATSENFKNKNGERVESTEWHNIVLWNRLAEVVEKYVKKGSQLYIEGKLRTRSYEKDGAKHYMTEIFANTMQMLGKKSTESSSSAEPIQSEEESQANMVNEADDLPF